MSWLSNLHQVYDRALQLDLPQEQKPIPINHSVQNAHINIVIDAAGQFIDAEVLEKTQIVLPATEKSAGRSSGEAPHPLADKLQYVAADYPEYGGLKKAYFGSYKELLSDWCSSDHSHPSVRAVLAYVSKGAVVKDLLARRILWADENGVLLTSWLTSTEPPPKIFSVLPKESGQLEQGNALVCWTVQSRSALSSKSWLDTDIQDSWVAFENDRAGSQGFCYVTGVPQTIALSHPAKLRHSGDKAKLISSNDLSGYTFRGRFNDTKKSIESNGLQGAVVGSITSQKAHNALRWLIGRKGAFRNGDQVLVSWARSIQPIPELFAGTYSYDLDDWGEVEDATDLEQERSNQSADIGQSYAASLSKFMNGYRANLAPDDRVSVMAIDSATPGRMGVTYYHEAMPGDYLDQLMNWHTDLAWYQRIAPGNESESQKKSGARWVIGAPSAFSILTAVYGDLVKGNESLKRNLYERLLPCIVRGEQIPLDFVRQSYFNAVRPTTQEHWQWQVSLSVACSLYKGFVIRSPDLHQHTEISMALDTENRSKHYLYGRLLGLAEKLEEVALAISNVKRPTTAQRLMHRFSERPYSTWLTIYKQLDPYMRQLKVYRVGFLTNISREIDEVMGLFEVDEFKCDEPLEGEFLLGFHCQRLSLRRTKSGDDLIDTTSTTESEGL